MVVVLLLLLLVAGCYQYMGIVQSSMHIPGC